MMVDKPTGSCKANAIASINIKPDNVDIRELKWIIDIGATHHVTYCDKILHDCKHPKKSNPNRVKEPKENKI